MCKSYYLNVLSVDEILDLVNTGRVSKFEVQNRRECSSRTVTLGKDILKFTEEEKNRKPKRSILKINEIP